MFILGVISTIFLGIACLYLGTNFTELNVFKRILFFGCCIAFILCGFSTYNEKNEQDRSDAISKNYFELNPPKVSTKPRRPEILFGRDCNYQFGTEGMVNFTDLFSMDLFTLEIIDQKMILNATFRDFNLNVIATVQNNFVIMRSNEYDYNRDDNGFEIVDVPGQNVVYQLDYCDSIVYYGGLLYNKQNNAFGYAYPINDKSKQIFEIGFLSENRIPHGLVQRKFKYPRQQFMSRRDVQPCTFNAVFPSAATAPERLRFGKAVIRGCASTYK